MNVAIRVNKELCLRARNTLPPEGYGHFHQFHVKTHVILDEEETAKLSDEELDLLVEYHVNTKRKLFGVPFPELASAKSCDFLAALKRWVVDVQAGREAEEVFHKEATRWSLEHGSKRLRLCAQEGFISSSTGLYKDERIDMELPDWEWLECIDGEADKRVLSPDEDGFALLETGRSGLPGCRLVTWRLPTPEGPQKFERRWALLGRFLGDDVILIGNERVV